MSMDEYILSGKAVVYYLFANKHECHYVASTAEVFVIIAHDHSRDAFCV